MEHTLFESLLEQKRGGQKADNRWKTKAWDAALATVLTVTPESEQPNCNIAKLKTKENYYKGLY